MSQSLYTAMGGISAAQTNLEVISNNIANLNTTAFKSSKVNFAEVYSTTISSGTGATKTTGGTNPIQVGLGVEVSSVSKNFSSGTWIATGETTDMMIQGNGFFTVTDSGGTKYYTRAGDFSFDSDGDLVTSDGYKVLGTSKLLATTTSTVPVHIPTKIVSKVTATDDISNTKVAEMNNCTLTQGKFNLKINGESSKTLTLDVAFDENTAVSSLCSNLQSQIETQMTAKGLDGSVKVTCADGTISFKVDGTDVTSLAFSNPAEGASNFISKTGLELAKKSADGKYTSDILDYMVNVSQVTSAETTVAVNSYSIGDDGSIEVTYSNGDKLAVELGVDGNTYQFVYTTAENVVIHGSDVYVDPNVATAANLVIQLASITNPDGLLSAGSNLYTAGPNSGDIIYSVGNQMGLGAISSGGLEASNVDLSGEFSAMILSQRAVQANSRVFSTTSDIMDTVVNMGR